MLSLILFQNDVYWSTNILRMTFVVVCLTVNYNDRIWSVMIIIIIVVWVMSLRFETERGRKRNERKEVTGLFWCTCGLDKFCIEKENVRRLILNMVDENHQCLSSSCAYIWLEEYVKIFSMVSFYIPIERTLVTGLLFDISIFAFHVHRHAFVFSPCEWFHIDNVSNSDDDLYVNFAS